MNIVTLQQKLKAGHTLIYQAKRGIVRISGPDSRDFLQRMSTNDLTKLSQTTPLASCFVNNKGRLVDLVYIFEESPSQFVLISSFSDASKLNDWIEKFHFVEDFLLEDLSKELRAIFHISSSHKNQALSFTVGDFDFDNSKASCFLSLSYEGTDEHIDDHCFDMICINMNMPTINEINAELMPQNIGLKKYIADNKGCFIGQEVIAKAITYQKHVKIMAPFKMEEQLFNKAQRGQVINDDQGKSGVISTLAPEYYGSWPQGLAIFKHN